MKVDIYSIPNCPACKQALHLATTHDAVKEAEYHTMGKEFQPADVQKLFPNARTFPQITVDGNYLGGFIDLQKLLGTYGK